MVRGGLPIGAPRAPNFIGDRLTSSGQAPILTVSHLSKKYASDSAAVDDITFSVEIGEFFVIMGPSGSGKTTLLKCVAGLVAPDSGKMILDGVDITDLPPDKRNASLIFQDYALFPHMTVKENVGFGLKLKKLPTGDIDRQVSSTLEKMGLAGFEKRMPRELSGGEKQRVAVARSLVVKPKVLLYDEPLANLDYRLQRKMEEELKLIHEEFGLTSVYVTHNQEQALSLGERIMVINKGVIEQVGRADQIYTNPENVFTARFMGEINVLNGKVSGKEGDYYRIQTQQGAFLGVGQGPIQANEPVYYCVRPEKMKSGGSTGPKENFVSGNIITTIYRGTDAEVLFSLGDGTRLTYIAYDVSPGAFKDRQGLELHWSPSDGLVLGEVSKVKGIDIEKLIYGR